MSLVWEAEDRAAELLRAWLAPDQRTQLAAFGAFAVVVEGRALVLVSGTHMVYEPASQTSYGWYPSQPHEYPPSDELLCQALALGVPGGLRKMLDDACTWPRGVTPSAFIRYDGPAWMTVDRLMAEMRA